MTLAMRHNAWRIDSIVIAVQNTLERRRTIYLEERKFRVAVERRKHIEAK
jgi:hypothetical protein